MDAKEFARKLESSIVEVKSQGHETVRCDNLIRYINELIEAGCSETDSTEATESQKARTQFALEEYKHNSSATLEMFKSVIQSGQNAIKTMLLLNGGAAIALLAFIGKLSDNNSRAIPDFAYSITSFVVGALLMGFVACLTYLAQIAFDSHVSRHQKIGTCLQISCAILGALSLASFAYGTYKTYQALLCLANCA